MTCNIVGQQFVSAFSTNLYLYSVVLVCVIQQFGQTPLHNAVVVKDIEIVKLLLKVPGIDVNLQSNEVRFVECAHILSNCISLIW
jgi:ankyrin repeat protein